MSVSGNAQPASMESRIIRYRENLGSLERSFPVRLGQTRGQRLDAFFAAEEAELDAVAFNDLSHDGKIDYRLLQNQIRHERRKLTIDAKRRAEIVPLIPFAETIIALEESRRRMEPVDPNSTATALNELKKAISTAKSEVELALDPKSSAKDAELETLVSGDVRLLKARANRAAQAVGDLDRYLDDWFKFFNGYDPLFTWWCEAPYKAVDVAIKDYANFLKDRLVGIKPDDTTTIIGFPIGAEALQAELDYERIPYRPEELVDIANKEYAWCLIEARKAAKAMGFGDDWKAALEKVKTLHVQPGEQPALIKELAIEAIEFLEKRDLVTIPELCKETWRMEMMSPERQLVSPFFLGGETIIVSFPTNTMAHESKLMSLRGNNRFFARATVQHELIPGHHLQGFMMDRYRPYRGTFYTPFWIEGWALYWEMRLWDLGFPKTPEEKMGMLFWRMHRCARIIFSLSFHLGTMSPQECVDFLVDKVGHERENALAEVRRSFGGDYGPLYQAAYMLGGLQFKAMWNELVQTKKMTERQFHDAILQNGPIPVEWVRDTLKQTLVKKDSAPNWRFYDN